MMKLKTFLFLTLILIFVANTATAFPTRITVRVKAKDAKFVGSSMGGMLVAVKDADTGELLAKGVATGSTGDTQILMKTLHAR